MSHCFANIYRLHNTDRRENTIQQSQPLLFCLSDGARGAHRKQLARRLVGLLLVSRVVRDVSLDGDQRVHLKRVRGGVLHKGSEADKALGVGKSSRAAGHAICNVA